MIKISRPNITEADISAVSSVLRSESLVQGAQVNEFEHALEEYLQVKNIVAVSSGTAALHLCLLDLNLGPQDVVYIPDYTFVATANVARIVQASIELVDVDFGTYCISLEQFEKRIVETRHQFAKATVLPVFEFGSPIDYEALRTICHKYEITLVEDAACAIGTELSGLKIGTDSKYCCFSLHPRKTVTTGEGGFIATNSKHIADNLRSLRNHGLSRNLDGSITCNNAGLNYRLTDFSAALGKSQLKRLPDALRVRKRLAALYHEHLESFDDIRLPDMSEGHGWQSFVIMLPANIDNVDVIERMKEKAIETNVGAYCLSLQPAYSSLDYSNLVNSKYLARHALAIPLCQTMSEEDIEYISKCLIEAVKF